MKDRMWYNCNRCNSNISQNVNICEHVLSKHIHFSKCVAYSDQTEIIYSFVVWRQSVAVLANLNTILRGIYLNLMSLHIQYPMNVQFRVSLSIYSFNLCHYLVHWQRNVSGLSRGCSVPCTCSWRRRRLLYLWYVGTHWRVSPDDCWTRSPGLLMEKMTSKTLR